ncbi:MAG: hypothetical protein KGJ77_01615 [Acidobacteriota bacterium]|nr:hypothetical protein [Acidobacteriota bacterium]
MSHRPPRSVQWIALVLLAAGLLRATGAFGSSFAAWTVADDNTTSLGTTSWDSFSLSTPSPTAGTVFVETITATLAGGGTDASYTGAKTVTFSGPSASPGGSSPSYPASVTFVAGVGTAPITLYDAQTTSITAVQGAVSGTSASFTVAVGSAGKLGFTNFTGAPAGSSQSGCPFGCTYTTFGKGNTVKVSVEITDSWGNIVSGFGAAKSVTLSTTGASVSPTSVTVPSSGTAQSPQFTYTAPSSNGWTSQTVTATATGYTNLTMTVNK